MDGLIHALYHGSNLETPLMCFINGYVWFGFKAFRSIERKGTIQMMALNQLDRYSPDNLLLLPYTIFFSHHQAGSSHGHGNRSKSCRNELE
jgi:hypothetical protein